MIRNTCKGKCFVGNKRETVEVPKFLYNEISKLELENIKLKAQVTELRGDVRMWRSKFDLK